MKDAETIINTKHVFVLYMPEWMVKAFNEGVEAMEYHNRIVRKSIVSLLYTSIRTTYSPEDNLYYHAKDGELFILEPDWVVEND